MLDVIAWCESRAANGLDGCAAAPGERYYTISGDTIKVGSGQRVIASAAYGANCDEAKVLGNSFGLLGLGFKVSSGPLGAMPSFLLLPGVPLKDGDTLTGQQDNANNNEDSAVVLVLQSDPVQPMPRGKAVHFKVDGATTATANTWTTSAVSLPSGLDPEKTYVIVDMHVAGATLYAWRLIAPWGNTQKSGAGWFGSTTSVTGHRPRLPEPIGKFKGSESSFTIEILCGDADTAQEIDISAVEV